MWVVQTHSWVASTDDVAVAGPYLDLVIDEGKTHMFPSQPQIGHDMARERQELAARMRLTPEIHPVRERTRSLFARIRSFELRSRSRRTVRRLEQEAG